MDKVFSAKVMLPIGVIFGVAVTWLVWSALGLPTSGAWPILPIGLGIVMGPPLWWLTMMVLALLLRPVYVLFHPVPPEAKKAGRDWDEFMMAWRKMDCEAILGSHPYLRARWQASGMKSLDLWMMGEWLADRAVDDISAGGWLYTQLSQVFAEKMVAMEKAGANLSPEETDALHGCPLPWNLQAWWESRPSQRSTAPAQA